MKIDLTGKKALVTGGSGGLGRTIVRTLAECGADVAIHYNSDRKSAEALVDELCASGRKAAAFRADGFLGLLSALFTFAIPALLLLPAFLLAASDGISCSLQLLRCFSKGQRPLPGVQIAFLRHIALIVFLCFAEALYCVFLLPIILSAV